MLLDSELQKLV